MRYRPPTPRSFSAPPISSSTLGSSMVAGIVQASPSAIFLMVPRRIFPERVFGRRCDDDGEAERRHRADLVADERHAFLLDVARRAVDAGLEHDEAARHLALELVLDAEHGAFGDVLVRRQHLLHAAGRKPVAGDVDDVVGAAHHIDVAVGIDVAGVGGLVVAGKLGEVALAPCGRPGCHKRRQARRRQRQLDHQRAHRAARQLLAAVVDGAHVVARHRHGRRAVLDRKLAEADRIAGDAPAGFGLPPVVDHRLLQQPLGPLHGVGIGALAGEEQRAEFRQIVFREMLALGVFLLDGAERGRRREERRPRRTRR